MPAIEIHNKPYRKPSPAERQIVIHQTIHAAMELLKTKLQLLRKRDPATLKSFTRWFGRYDAKSQHIILERIRNLLFLLKRTTYENFYEITNLPDRRKAYYLVYPHEAGHRIALGRRFWQAPLYGPQSKAGKLIQALSHFKKAGSLRDYAVGENTCIALATANREKALRNAENFARFIES